MEAQQNPLQQYFRQIKLYIKLPSGTSYYTPDVMEFTNGEVGVMPMTGKDELLLKNPDALLNGEALLSIISSCVPAAKFPNRLLANDIDALITAIRYATYNDSLEMNLTCLQCGAENTYKLDLQYALDNMSYLDEEYVVNLDNGLTVYVRPYAFPELLKGLHTQFESQKLARAIENDNLDEKKKSEIFTSAFREIAVTKFKIMTNIIVKVIDESRGVNVSDKNFISDFLQNADRNHIDEIDKVVNEINKIGIKKTFGAKCEKCEHEWTTDIDFNPVNFL
jgi:hypothetical protein